jgi:hypothetical protein
LGFWILDWSFAQLLEFGPRDFLRRRNIYDEIPTRRPESKNSAIGAVPPRTSTRIRPNGGSGELKMKYKKLKKSFAQLGIFHFAFFISP